MSKKRKITIHFNTGTALSFVFAQQVEDTQIGTALQNAMREDKLAVEAEGKLFVFAWSSIRYVEMYPPPSKLPASVIKGAQLSE